ncbi:MAG: HAD family hydrolase [Pseudomonadota bacterium]
MRLVMWSGPRNLSTAMMRAFEARGDCTVMDEPFYAVYLATTGLHHPMRDAILAAHETNADRVIEACTKAPAQTPIVYQKHMTHHMVDGIDLSWVAATAEAFLIRDPAAVAASYEAKRENPTLGDLGVERQTMLFERAAERTGRTPPVIDADDVLANPARVLAALCAALSIPFTNKMLRWPAGRRANDGVWATHWYRAVERSTGFGPPRPPGPLVSDHARRLADAARPYYDRLALHRLGAPHDP